MKQLICMLCFFISYHSFAQTSAEIAIEQKKSKYELFHTIDNDKRFSIAIKIAYNYIYGNQEEIDSTLVYLKIASEHPNLSHQQQLEIWHKYIAYYKIKEPVAGYEYLDSTKQLVLAHPEKTPTLQQLKLFRSAARYYDKLGDYDKAKENFDIAINIAKRDTSRRLQQALGFTCLLKAELLLRMQDTIGAFLLADSGIVISQRAKLSFPTNGYIRKASIYYRAGKIEKALNIAEVAKQNHLNQRLSYYLVHTLVCANFKLGNYKSALQYAFDFTKRGIESHQKGNPKFINDILSYGHQAAEKLGEQQKRLFIMEAHIEHFDEILKENVGFSALNKYLHKKAKEQQALLLQQKDELFQLETEKKQRQQLVSVVFLLGFLVLLILVAIVFNRLKLTRVQKKIIEQEQEKSEHLLLNILPYEIAQELKNTYTSPAKSFPIATVLFTDFVGFTKLANQLSPVELLSTLNEYFLAFDTIMEHNGVEKIKTIGDAYMAVGGIPIQKDNHALSVIKSAVEIIDFVEQTKQRKIREGKPYFEIRIGIHSGSLVAGIVGKTKFAYDVWGDAVNLASRLESNSEPGKINISADTYHLVKRWFNCTYRGKLKAKGLGMKDMYFVEAG